MIRFDAQQVVAAREGNRAALDAVVRAAERPVFNLAVRMLANRVDAEDATQEILVKIITNLGSIRDVEAAGAWAFKIACRHLVHERRSGAIEAMRLSFEGFATDLETGLSPLSDHGLNEIEAKLAIDEVKIGCTLAMLVCLSRELRITYILGDIFEVTDTEAAEILEIDPAAYRQRLRRARGAVTGFVTKSCGLVSESVPCRCQRRVGQALRVGRIAKGQSDLRAESPSVPSLDEIRSRIGLLERGRASAALMRSNPDFSSRVSELMSGLIDRCERRG
ncbi:RNA polymerase sigma factor [Bosea sp. (in: a-proteobacteria)]|jgi:RNA polymerase sigma factor (sigma-70 family)|uniref:RNA polymerase sigma factor n=1 Tax=Bosea sp. (in: a-proteobacteria) TaxID=1871050 RepID=UPI00356AA13A